VSLLAARAEVLESLLDFLFQPRNIGWPAVLIADRVDQQFGASDAESLQIPVEHFDDLGFDGRIIALPQHFDSDLSELAVAAFLRALPTELGTDVEELCKPRLVGHALLDVCAHCGGRRLR